MQDENFEPNWYKITEILWAIFNNVLVDWESVYCQEEFLEFTQTNKKILFNCGDLHIIKFIVDKSVQMAGNCMNTMLDLHKIEE